MNNQAAPLPFTGERYIPGIYGGVELEHFHRYLFAEQVVQGRRVLDIASGEGYGSALLARSAAHVIGVDISAEAVAHAQEKYQADNLEYRVGSCAAIPLADHSIDIVVSFETIEHHDQHEAMMSEIKRVLKPQGLLVISCPDKYEYSDRPGYKNEYHVKELYRDEFERLLASRFQRHVMFGQRAAYGSLIFQEAGAFECVTHQVEDKMAHPVPGLSHAVYLIAIASDVQLPAFKAGLLDQALESVSEIADRDVWIAKLNETIQSLILDRDAQKAGYEQLKAEVDSRALKSLMAWADRWSGHEEAIAERDAHIASLSTVNQALMAERNEYQLKSQQLEEDIQRLSGIGDQHLSGSGPLIDALLKSEQAKGEEVAALKAEMLAMRRSTSWWITSPIRVVVNVVRRILGRSPAQARTGGQSRQNWGAPVARNAGGKRTPESDPPAGAQPADRYRVLLASYYCPTRAHAGGLRILDMYALIRQQCPDARIDLYTINRPSIDWSLDDAEKIFDNIYLAGSDDLDPEELRALQGGLSPRYDVVDLQFHQTARRMEAFRTIGAKVLFTPMESQAKAFYLELVTRFKAGKGPGLRRMAGFLRVAIEEIRYCRQADEVVCVSETDASFLRRVGAGSRVHGIETGISQIEFGDALKPDYVPRDPGAKGLQVIFVAYFGSQTNIDALNWFLEKVHPLVRQKMPGYRLSVVGRGNMSLFHRYRDDCLELVGEVPEIAPYIADARVGIAPALGGSGLRGKVNQYAVLGVPCVVSPVALQGLAYTDAENVCVAEAPEKFAADCVRLLTDLDFNRRIAAAGRRLSLEHYSWQSKWPQIGSVYAVNGAV